MESTLIELAAEIFQGLTLIKVLAAVFMVVLLSLTAEHVSPRFAGVLSGYPLGAALSLFFIGYEISPEFAGQSALYTLAGLSSTALFAWGYQKAVHWTEGWSKGAVMVLGSICGLACFLISAFFLSLLPRNIWLSLAVSLAILALLDIRLRPVKNVTITHRAPLGWSLLLIRALAAAAIIILVTSAARLIGPAWAGLLSAFPFTLFPFLVIMHFTYEARHVYTIIKNVPRGLISLVIYTLAVAWSYPACGLVWGTIISYALATLYLILINIYFIKERRQKPLPGASKSPRASCGT